jgi:hypothetical protein
MPIVRIFTNLSEAEHLHKVAKAGAEVFRSLGVRDEHITTTITHSSGDDLFVADKTFAQLHGGEFFLLASVSMGSKRSADVRDQLARAYTEAVSGLIARNNVSVDFIVRDGGDVYVGGFALGSAIAHRARPGHPKAVTHRELDEALRILLAKEWNVGHTGWDPSTPLTALRDESVEWDSLEVAGLAVLIETNLSLAHDLDTGEYEIRKAFGLEATYADLLALVESCST